MPPFGLDEDGFWKSSPDAAESIFKHRREDPELRAGAWAFVSGVVDGGSSYATFSCVALTGYGSDELFISAIPQPDGTWKLTHKIKRAG